jgi:hypothetical protein
MATVLDSVPWSDSGAGALLANPAGARIGQAEIDIVSMQAWTPHPTSRC